MFGKVIKNEIRHSARYNLPIYAIGLAASLIMGLSLLFNSSGVGVFSCIALYIIGIVTVVVTFISVIKNFYDTLFARQGYLTLTLPVKGSSLLLSKVLVSFLWIIIGFMIMATTLLLILFYVREQTESEVDIIKTFIEDLGMLNLIPSGGVIAKLVAVFVVLGISKMLTYVGYIYFSVTIANTKQFQKHPGLFGVITFLVIMSLSSRISDFLTQTAPLTFFVTTQDAFFSFDVMGSIDGVLLSYGIGGTISSAIIALILLFITGYIIENKVNIK